MASLDVKIINDAGNDAVVLVHKNADGVLKSSVELNVVGVGEYIFLDVAAGDKIEIVQATDSNVLQTLEHLDQQDETEHPIE